MPRAKKDNVPLSIRLAKDVHDELTEFCTLSGQPKTVAIERALRQYINDNKGKFQSTPKPRSN